MTRNGSVILNHPRVWFIVGFPQHPTTRKSTVAASLVFPVLERTSLHRLCGEKLGSMSFRYYCYLLIYCSWLYIYINWQASTMHWAPAPWLQAPWKLLSGARSATQLERHVFCDRRGGGRPGGWTPAARGESADRLESSHQCHGCRHEWGGAWSSQGWRLRGKTQARSVQNASKCILPSGSGFYWV